MVLFSKSGFTNEQAVRVYLWSVEGKDIPGLSKSDAKELIDIVRKNLSKYFEVKNSVRSNRIPQEVSYLLIKK